MMKRFVQFLAFCALYLLSFNCYSQADIPIDYQRGTAMVAVPLYEIKDRGISIPISLSYTSTGVKLASTESGGDLVGINWSLLAGGRISRKVNGLPDDYSSMQKAGWLTNNTSKSIENYLFSADNALSTCDEGPDWTNLDSNTGFRYKDTEPDEFEIMLPGLSGKFVFDNNRTIRTVPYQDITVKPTFAADGAIASFEILSPEGIKYVFSKRAMTIVRTEMMQENQDENNITIFRRNYDLYKSLPGDIMAGAGVTYTMYWALTEVLSPQGGDIKIDYYEPKPLTTYNYTTGAAEIASPDVSPVALVDAVSTVKRFYLKLSKEQELRIKSVSASTGSRADFFIFKNQQPGIDLNRLEEAYTKITVSDSVENQLQVLKNFDLSYYTVKDPLNKVRRSFLKSVQEGTTCYKFPPYTFNYFGIDNSTTNLNEGSSNAQDYFGYSNNTEPGLVDVRAPSMWYGADPGGQIHFSLYNSIVTGDITYRLPTEPNIPNSREILPLTITDGSLSKIVYPPGGYVTFEYEPNQYYSQSDNTHFLAQDTYGPGIRIRKIVSHDALDENNNMVKEIEYLNENGSSSGVVTSPYQFAVDANALLVSKFNLNENAELRYQRVTLKVAGKKSTVFEYEMPPAFPALTSGDWNATLIKPIRSNIDGICPEGTFLSSKPYSYPYVKNTNTDQQDGLLKHKYDFNGDGILVKRTDYEYQRITPGAAMIKAFKFDNMFNSYLVGEYNILADVKRVLKKETSTDFDPSNPAIKVEKSVSSFYESTKHKFLTRILSQNSTGETLERTFSYAKDFSMDAAFPDETSLALKNMNDAHILTPIVEDASWITRNGVKRILGSTLTKYKTVGSVVGLKAEILSLPKLDGGFSTAVLSPVGGVQQFISDPQYLSTGKFETYDDKANLINFSDGKKNQKAFLFGYNKKYLIAEIVNAKADEVAFSDFEVSTEQSFEVEDYENISTNDYYSGNKAQYLNYSYWIKKTVHKGRGKFYRLTYHGKTMEFANGQVDIELSDGNHTVSASITTNPSLTEWKFYEKMLDVSSLNSTFTITIRPRCDLIIDDLAFYPAAATLTAYTYQIPFGKSAEIDSRGNMVSYDYDDLGRLKFVKDGDRNIVKHIQYKINNDFPVEFSADFTQQVTSNIEGYQKTTPGKANVGDTYYFKQQNTCVSELTHSWYVNDIYQGNGPGLDYTFNAIGNYTIKHVVSHPISGTKTAETTLEAIKIPLTIELNTNGARELTWCDYQNGTITKTFTATIKSGSSNGPVVYNWTFPPFNNTNPAIQKIAGGGINDNYITIRYPYGYYVMCRASNGQQETLTESIRIDYYNTDCLNGQ
ncbi:hypothetical protein [Pedobacter sp. SG908]|uniref:hypothetical protein n=1 Tax=Pedobacter sp. SG908 TaxID=2587135 RepID=UPI001420BEBF|nr:hypothetical protein [Pedobacter sp. SG908]NII83106.1 hypothetical protein [Pedobacter sp. SG908]